MNRLMTAVSATALSLSMIAGAAFSQELGLKQLQDSATSAMAQLNMDTAMIESLSLDELTQIQAVSSSAGTQTSKVQRIETIMTGAEERIAAGGSVEPTAAAGDLSAEDLDGDMVVKAYVGAYLAKLGIADEVDVEAMTTDELLQVQLVQESNDGPDEQRIKIKEMMAN